MVPRLYAARVRVPRGAGAILLRGAGRERTKVAFERNAVDLDAAPGRRVRFAGVAHHPCAGAAAAAPAGGGSTLELVNLAGGMVARKTLADMDEAFFDQVMTLNLKSAFLVTKAALPHIPDGAARADRRRSGSGRAAPHPAWARAGV